MNVSIEKKHFDKLLKKAQQWDNAIKWFKSLTSEQVFALFDLLDSDLFRGK